MSEHIKLINPSVNDNHAQRQPGSQDSRISGRDAFLLKDVEASKQFHSYTKIEDHKSGGSHIKTAIFGGLDGIVTCFAIVAGAAGLNYCIIVHYD